MIWLITKPGERPHFVVDDVDPVLRLSDEALTRLNSLPDFTMDIELIKLEES